MADGDDGDDALLRRYLGEGDLDALDVLLERHRALAVRLARRFLHDPADAEDAVQTAYCNIIAVADRKRPQISFRAWMLAAVANACRMHLREHQRRREREQIAASGPPQDTANEAEADELRLAVRREVDSLPERLRMPLWLVFRDGLSTTEVSEVLAMPDRTVRHLLRQGLDRLRRTLGVRGIGAAAIPALLALPDHAQAAESAAAALGSGSSVGLVVASVTTAVAGIALIAVVGVLGNGQPSAPHRGPEIRPLLTIAPDDGLGGLLDAPVRLSLRRHRIAEAMTELSRALDGRLPWSCTRTVADTPRHGIDAADSPTTVRAVLDRLAAASGARWEVADGVVRWFSSGEDAAAVIAQARRLDQPGVLATLDRLTPTDPAVPIASTACAAGDAGAQAALGRLLSDPEPQVAALRLAGSWRADWAVPALGRIASRLPASGMRGTIILVVGGDVAVHTIMRDDPRVRAALSALGEIGTPESVDILIRLDHDVRERSMRTLVLRAIARAGTTAAVTHIAAIVRADPTLAGQALGDLDDRPADQGDGAALVWDDPRRAVPRPDDPALERLRGEAADAIAAGLSGPRQRTAVLARQLLIHLGAAGGQRLATHALAGGGLSLGILAQIEPGTWVRPVIGERWREDALRAWAMPVAVRAGDQAAIAAALAALRSARTAAEDPDTRLLAALAATREPAVTEALLAWTTADTPLAQRRAVMACLADTRDPRADAVLISACADPDPEIRRWALSGLPTAEHGRLARHLIQDADESVRQACATLLRDSDAPADAEALAQALADADDGVRMWSAHALLAIVARGCLADAATLLTQRVAAAAEREQEPLVVSALGRLQAACAASAAPPAERY